MAETLGKSVNLVYDLDRMAALMRLKQKEIARNCADAARSLRQWLDEQRFRAKVDPFPKRVRAL